MLSQVGGRLGEGRLVGTAVYIVAVVVEEDVLHARLELLFLGQVGRSHIVGNSNGAHRRIDGDPGSCIRGTAIATRYQVIAGRLGGRHGLDAGGRYVPDALDRDAAGVCSAP